MAGTYTGTATGVAHGDVDQPEEPYTTTATIAIASEGGDGSLNATVSGFLSPLAGFGSFAVAGKVVGNSVALTSLAPQATISATVGAGGQILSGSFEIEDDVTSFQMGMFTLQRVDSATP